MKALIVSKIKIDNRLSLDAITQNGECIRLLTKEGTYFPTNSRIDVGEIWDIDYIKTDHQNPFSEDVRVHQLQWIHRLEDVSKGIFQLIDRLHIPFWSGSPITLFEGFLFFTADGVGFLDKQSHIPTYSTGFWISPLPLKKDKRQPNIYHYSTHFYSFPYAGTLPSDKTPDVIPANTLVRVYLSSWKQESAKNNSGRGERSYLQIAGWYT